MKLKLNVNGFDIKVWKMLQKKSILLENLLNQFSDRDLVEKHCSKSINSVFR